MDAKAPEVQGLRPGAEIMTLQRLPCFIGISGQAVGTTGLSMHLKVVPYVIKAGSGDA